ncbi:MAG: response regulator [Rhodospirillales bacterium]|nr:response regulator [Rhodospirillales bacterium]
MSTTLVTLTIVGTAILAVRLPQIVDANKALVARAAAETSSRIEIFLEGLEQRVLLVGQTAHDLPKERVADMLDAARGDAFEAVYLVDDDGIITANSIRNVSPERSQEMIGVDLSQNKLVRAINTKGAVVWSDKFLSAVTGKVTIGVGLPVGQIGGVVIAELPITSLLKISQIASGSGGEDFWIIDGHGEVVAETGSPSAARLNLLSLPIVRNGLANHSATDTTDFKDQKYHTAASFSGALGWLFVSRIPAGLNNPKIRETIGLILIAFIASPIIGLLLAPFWARGMNAALGKVTRYARLVATGVSPDSWPRGNITEFNALSTDLEEMCERLAQVAAEQTALSKDLEKAKNNAEFANRAKSNFLATMSHEIRTPLNGVLGLAQLLKGTELDEDQWQKVDTILSSGQTLLAILNDVLDMSKIEAGGLELEEQVFSLTGLVSTITSPFQSLADDKGLRLVVNCDANHVVRGDPVRTRQILWNLLSNAIKFTDQGQINLTVKKSEWPTHMENLASSDKNYLLLFTIEDTGAGISSDRINAIFEAFTQEDNSITRKFGGTGLGLSIVKQMTELMGGTVNVESTQGVGSKFIVYLPFHEVTKEEALAISQRDPKITLEFSKPLNVLIAEDNDVNAIIARAFLEKFGHSVKHVVNGKLAVEAAKDGWADLILMDIHMPEMNGIDATRTIRSTATGQHLPIVGLTAEAFADRHTAFIEAGMNEVLTKPYTEQQLARVLARSYQIERRRSRRGTAPGPEIDGAVAPAATAHSAPDKTMPAKSSQAPTGDEKRLNELRAQLPAEAISSLLAEAQSSLQTNLEKLQESVHDKDPDAIRETAHAIKGASGSLFAVQISEMAAEIEQQSEDIEGVRRRLPEFELAAKDALDWWQAQSAK